MNVDDFVTWVQRPEDLPYLRSRLLPVNMRLFRDQHRYRRIILSCCNYLRFVALSDLEGYDQPFGMSGANLALPFNIIAVVYHRGTPAASCQILINPEILEYLGPLKLTKSNCGSIRLAEPIDVPRYSEVRVRYYDEEGLPRETIFTVVGGSFTVQHEVDHNLGILITDEKVAP